MILGLLYITLIICFIIDVSGFINSLKYLIIYKILKFKDYNISLKPLDCSLCMTWWIGLIYIFCFFELSLLNIVIVICFSYLSSSLTMLMIAIKDIINKLINKLLDYANKD